MDEDKKQDDVDTQTEGAEGAKTPPAGESPAPESDLMRLQQQLEVKEREAKEYYDRFVRQLAEFENFKKRTGREKEEAIRFANEMLIRDLLPVVDNLERAVDHAKGGGNGKPLVEGVEMVLKGFLDVLDKHGVKQMLTIGETFDPGKHEAMAHVESDDHAPNTVMEEYHKGYFLFDRLLRPALVSVAKTPETKEKKKEDAEVEKEPTDD